MRRPTKFFALAASIALVGSLMGGPAAPIVAAGTQGSCVTGLRMIYLYENVSGDTQDGNDLLCIPYAINLDADPEHTLPGGCMADFLSNRWNDCMSSYKVRLPARTRACFYNNSNYGGFLFQWYNSSYLNVTSERINLPRSQADMVSSFKTKPYSESC